MNKKLLKSIVCIAAGVGIATSIPFTTTSCGCSSEKIIPLPDSVYLIYADNVLCGFKDEFLNDPTSPIYKDKFTNCNTIIIPANIERIENGAFYIDYAVKTNIPSFISKLAFADGSKCSIIGAQSFRACPSLVTVTFPKCQFTLQNWVFMDCTSLTSINFSNEGNLERIRGYAFKGCSSLKSITLPKGLKKIDPDSFLDCKSLVSIMLPSSLETVNGDAFKNCPKLNSITWDAWNGNITLEQNSFSGVAAKGTVKVTHPINAEHNSKALLDLLKQSGGLSSGWTAA